jgi:hypothetical protein
VHTFPLFAADVTEAISALAGDVVTSFGQLDGARTDVAGLVALFLCNFLELLILLVDPAFVIVDTLCDQAFAIDARDTPAIVRKAYCVDERCVGVRDVFLRTEKLGAIVVGAVYAVSVGICQSKVPRRIYLRNRWVRDAYFASTLYSSCLARNTDTTSSGKCSRYSCSMNI